MNESIHPDTSLLNAYALQPDADDFYQLRLHLLSCKQCRDEVTLGKRFKADFSVFQSEHRTEDQQRIVDDYLYNEKNEQQRQHLKQQILNDPIMLKSTLFSLSHKSRQQETGDTTRVVKSNDPGQGWPGVLPGWLTMKTPIWASMGVTAVITLALTVFMLQRSIDSPVPDTISIASYQDNNVIRFLPRDQLPGIGFFNRSMQAVQPFENMQIALDKNQMLEFSWMPVKLASAYQFNLFRFSGGEKKLLKTLTTEETHSDYQLQLADYNHRFEWVLSGHTTDDKTFITSGGFVVQNQLNRGER